MLNLLHNISVNIMLLYIWEQKLRKKAHKNRIAMLYALYFQVAYIKTEATKNWHYKYREDISEYVTLYEKYLKSTVIIYLKLGHV